MFDMDVALLISADLFLTGNPSMGVAGQANLGCAIGVPLIPLKHSTCFCRANTGNASFAPTDVAPVGLD